MFFERSPLGIPSVRNMRCHLRAAGNAGVQLSGVRGDICICGARWGPWGSRCWGYVVSFAFEFWNVICIWRSSRRTRRRGIEEGNIQALQSWRRENVIQWWCFTICYFHVAYVAYVTFFLWQINESSIEFRCFLDPYPSCILLHRPPSTSTNTSESH